MAYLEHSDLRELFDVVEDIKEARLTLCLNAAARTLKSWVGADTYDEAADDTLETLKFAEANLAVYHLLLNTGARIRRSGLVKKEQDAGGSVTNNVANEYYSAAEIIELRREYYNTALDAAEPYRVSQSSGSKTGTLQIGTSYTT